MKLPVKIVLLVPLFLATLDVVLLTHFTTLPLILAGVSLLFLLYLPGALTLQILKISFSNICAYLANCLAISITWIYILGLIASFVFPHFGFDRPLDLVPFAYLPYGLLLLLLPLAALRNWQTTIEISRLNTRFWGAVGYFGALSLALVSVAGAFYLNIGGSNLVSIAWITALVIGYFLISLVHHRDLDFLKPYLILTLSLSLLWMLSARSWHLIGWDIVQEFSVAKGTLGAGKWSIGDLHDAYNACLSITLLPTVLSNLTSLPIEFIFKFIYPLIFAHFPLLIYFFLKKFFKPGYAFLAVLYVMAQPFFMQPMVALARQEIGFFFFAILLLTIYSNSLKKKTHIFLTIFYIFGLVVSHYSTSYVAIILLAPFLGIVIGIQVIKLIPWPSAIQKLSAYQNWFVRYTSTIKWWMVVALVGFTYAWYFLITQSAGNVALTIRDSFGNMADLFKGDQKSQEVQQAIPGQNNTLATTTYDLSYFEQTNSIALNNLPQRKLDEISADYPLKPLNQAVVKPLLDSGTATTIAGILDRLKDILKFMLILGSVILFLRSLRKQQLEQNNLDLVVFCGLSTMVLLAMILHPTLGLHYNISRIYLQLLCFISICVVISFDTILWLLPYKLRVGLTSAVLVLILLYLQGVLTPLIGGVPVLHFYNFGTDYEKFYVFEGEYSAAHWLETHRNYQSTVYGDDLSGLRIREEFYLFTNTNIIPVTIANNAQSYVYLSYANKVLGKAQVNFNDKFLTYTYPSPFLDEYKNLIYSNSSSAIYK